MDLVYVCNIIHFILLILALFYVIYIVISHFRQQYLINKHIKSYEEFMYESLTAYSPPPKGKKYKEGFIWIVKDYKEEIKIPLSIWYSDSKGNWIKFEQK